VELYGIRDSTVQREKTKKKDRKVEERKAKKGKRRS
jgi:hypothetical protein